MARPEKRIDAAGGVEAEFAKELRQLRAQAGNPTYRDMARAALFSSSVLSSAASGSRLPTLQVTLGFVAACGGERDVWRRRWLRAAHAVNADALTSTRLTDTPAGQPTTQTPAGPVAWKTSSDQQPSEPKMRAQMPRPAQLPLRTGGLVGRQVELARLCAGAPTSVVVTGPVGVGKSEFALHYAHHLATGMADGQLYADLASRPGAPAHAECVVDGFLRALGVPEEHLPRTADQRAGLYRSLLAERRLVVLLDNVRDERQVRPLLTESQYSVTLMVSSAPLRGLGGVRRIRLNVPPRTDSIAMIAAAVPERAEVEPAECDRLAELCGDLPLALDITLRKLTTRPNLTLHQAAAKLIRPDKALSWLKIGDVSLRESLNSTYREVSDAARTLLTRIAQLPFHCDPESVMPDGEDVAEELTEAGLLRRGDQQDTYRMDRLVRAFSLTAVAAASDDVDAPLAEVTSLADPRWLPRQRRATGGSLRESVMCRSKAGSRPMLAASAR
ncbi:MAG: hypothetical protein ACRCYU_04180 [Nocardioides sp.]